MSNPTEPRKSRKELYAMVARWKNGGPSQCLKDVTHTKPLEPFTKDGRRYLGCTAPGCGYQKEDRLIGGAAPRPPAPSSTPPQT